MQRSTASRTPAAHAVITAESMVLMQSYDAEQRCNEVVQRWDVMQRCNDGVIQRSRVESRSSFFLTKGRKGGCKYSISSRRPGGDGEGYIISTPSTPRVSWDGSECIHEVGNAGIIT